MKKHGSGIPHFYKYTSKLILNVPKLYVVQFSTHTRGEKSTHTQKINLRYIYYTMEWQNCFSMVLIILKSKTIRLKLMKEEYGFFSGERQD